jgi:hypothetical protein
MLGRKNYTQAELNHGRTAVQEQLAVYKQLAETIASEKTGQKLQSTLQDFEELFFNNLTLALDRYYIHRMRAVTRNDGNAQ